MRLRRPEPLFAAILGLALTLGSCLGDDRAVVTTETVRAAEVTQTVSAPARVDAAARQDVAATVGGEVAGIEVADGARVEAGQVVIRLASGQVERAREQAEAAESAAQPNSVRIAGTGNTTRQATNDAVRQLDETVQPQIAEARAGAAHIPDPQQRAATEAAINAVDQAYRATRAALLAGSEAVAAQQDAAAQNLTRALNEALRQTTEPQRLQAEAAAQAAAAQADALVLVAPFVGTVQLATGAAADGAGAALLPGLPAELSGLAGELGGGAPGGSGTLRVGAPVAPGQVLFTVFDLSERYVNADVDEFDAPEVAIGQAATVLVDAFGHVEFDGLVEAVRVEAGPTEAGGLGFRVRIRLLGPRDGGDTAAGLRVGMSAAAEIATRTETSDTVVPSRALLRRDGETVVFAVRDGHAVRVPVSVDALGEDLAAVTGDLRLGDEVVVTGYEDLVDGAEVRVERAPRPAR